MCKSENNWYKPTEDLLNRLCVGHKLHKRFSALRSTWALPVPKRSKQQMFTLSAW